MKKTRINISSSLKIYFNVFLSFIFKNKNQEIFLNNLKNFLSTENILITSQGRVAAYNIFKVILEKNKKEILISPYTLTEVINAIIYAGGTPIYIDIDIKSGLPLKKDLDKKINNKTAGLVITHLYSNQEDITKFMQDYANKLTIIEDVAINFGAKIEDKKFLGTLFDYGFYSFGVMKNLSTFHGGAIYSKNNKKLDEIEKNLNENKEYPFIHSIKLIFLCILIDVMYSKYIYNYFTHHILKISIKKIDKFMYPGVYPKILKKMPNHYNYKFQKNFAFAGIENLKILEKQINNRVKNVKLYEKYLKPGLKINKFISYDINSFLEYPILLKRNNNKFISKKLLFKGYDIRHTWYVNSIRYLNLDYREDEFYNSELLHDKVLSLPTHNKINESDIQNICDIINFYEN